MRAKAITFMLMWALFMTGCLQSEPEATPREVVEHVWQLVDTRYALFADKPGLDWPAQRARALDMLKTGDDRALFEVLDAMLSELQDGHTNLIAPFDVSWHVPAYADYPNQYDESLMMRDILKSSFSLRGSLRYTVLEDTSIGYMRVEDFNSMPSEEGLEVAFTELAQITGLIIDLRQNGGGSLEQMKRFLARLTNESMVMFEIAYTSGPAHDALTEPEARQMSPSSGTRYTKPVVLLVDRQSYSAANTFAFAMRHRAEGQVTLVGDHTGGGGSIPYTFELPNGWQLRLSTSRMTDKSGAPMEPGIAPDLRIDLDPMLIPEGRDSILEAALDILN